MIVVDSREIYKIIEDDIIKEDIEKLREYLRNVKNMGEKQEGTD